MATLIASTVLYGVASLLFLRVHAALQHLSPNPELRSAARGFRLWWLMLAVNGAFIAIMVISAAAGMRGPNYFALLQSAAFVAACTGVAGLIHYMVVLLGGPGRMWPAWALSYGVLAAYTLWGLWSSDPSRVVVGQWRVVVAGANAPSAVFRTVTSFGLSVPMLLVSLGYPIVYRRVSARTQHYRVAMVGAGIFSMALFIFLGGLLNMVGVDWWQVVGRVVAIVVAVLALWAYHPPAFIRHRLRVEAIAPAAVPASDD